MSAQLSATDLTDEEWSLLVPLLPGAAPTGRPRRHAWRTLLNAICYQLRTGGAGRFRPQEWPPGKTVSQYLRQGRVDGTWVRLPTPVREHLRVRLGRDPQPSAGSSD